MKMQNLDPDWVHEEPVAVSPKTIESIEQPTVDRTAEEVANEYGPTLMIGVAVGLVIALLAAIFDGPIKRHGSK
jgi:cobalamin biosynthesis protein CobD/CbiB